MRGVLGRVIFRFALVACWLPIPVAVAAAPDHPVVPGFERFYAETNSDSVAGGQLLLGELNCLSCHQPEQSLDGLFGTKQAPILDEVGARVKPDYLRKFLADPQAVKSGTSMPNLLDGLPENQRREYVEALVQYLVAAGPGEPLQDFPNVGAAAAGDKLFHSVGCMACHGSQQQGAEPLATSVPLGELLPKYTLASLSSFLQDPLHVRPSGRMPSLNLSPGEARTIASYLLKGLPEVANLRFSYYEGSWSSTPDFGKLGPKTTGGADRIDVSFKQRGDQFGLRFEGFLRIDQEGEYTFHLGSDDGSRLTIDDRTVVDNAGVHPYGVKSAKARLIKGFHAVVVDYFEQAGEEQLTAEYEGPGVDRQPMAAAMLVIKDPPSKENLSVTIQPDLVAKGRALFASLGCASCHQLKDGDAVVVSLVAAKPLGKLDASAGCVSAAPPENVPHFSLSDRQRASLTAAIGANGGGPIAALNPSQQIDETLTRLNCLACHERNQFGGVEPQRNALFQTTIPEMGDEGRIPPLLTGVGAKLTPAWMKHVLSDGSKDRPYMLTRMPKFGYENVGQLQSLLERVDVLDPAPPVQFAEPPGKVKAAGRQLVGDKGFSCIKCHQFGRFEATGIQAMDLRTMSQRLNENWFVLYLRDPQQFRPRTRMPTSWPESGPSLIRDVLDGDSPQQMAAIWAYLSDGPRARIPAGLKIESLELIPIDEAIIYRNFIEGAGSRAIGVGYPEGVHLAFDANNIRLALLWQGRFIDASKHWSGRGQGFEPPAGEKVLKLPDAVTFAVLADAAAPWPGGAAEKFGYRFRGYRLSPDQRPTFLYSLGEIQVEDFFNPIIRGPNVTLERELTVKSGQPLDVLWLRAAVGGTIDDAGDGWFVIDGKWKTRLTTDSTMPTVRKSGGKVELLLPVQLDRGERKIVQEFSW